MSERRLSGTTRVAGVIGDPVRHSLSPALYNAAFAHLGLDWAYVAFAAPTGRGGDAVRAMRALGIDGLSVTMPHKRAAWAACDDVTPHAQLLGAVNCVSRDGDRLIGHNTDGSGFVNALRDDLGLAPAGLRAVVVGAGAAGCAVIVALASAGASVVVVNRTEQAARAAERLGNRAAAAAGTQPAVEATTDALADAPGTDTATDPIGARGDCDARGACGSVQIGSAADVADAQLVVNATSLGMTDRDRLPLDVALLGPQHTVVDLVYSPARTPLLHAADAAGAVTRNGVGMLLFQAAEQFRLWTGCPAPVQAMAQAVHLSI